MSTLTLEKKGFFSTTAISQEQNTLFTPNGLMDYFNTLDRAPADTSGSWGPISWNVTVNIDYQNILNSYADVKISIFGIKIIDGRIDFKNPSIKVDLTVLGVGVKAELGIDFEKRKIYFKGTLNYVLKKTDFDITIFSF
jgi:hypothetical protein